jgi:hypothetical protein
LDSNDIELLASFVRRLPKYMPFDELNPTPGTLSIANPDYCESSHLWFYPLYSRRVESGESVTQSVSGSFNVLNPEPSALLLASAHLLVEYSSDSHVSVEQDSDHRTPITLPLAEENTESLHPGDPLEDKESIPSSMTHYLDSESDPAYSPSSCSHSSPGSDPSLSCHVDMETVQGEIPIQDVSSASGSSASIPDLDDVGGSEVAMRGVGEPSTSKPPIECRPEFMTLKNIWAFLWAPLDFIKEECSVKDNARLTKVEKR